MPKNAIVVGMPRSGTSLTANVFARQGYTVSHISESTVRAGDDYNPFGYFEANELIERNVEVLRRAGFEGHNTWLFDPISPEAVCRIGELEPLDADRALVAAYERSAPWLWKDPRLCYTLAYWWKLMDPERTRVVLVRRDPLDIYRSFRRKGWRPAGEPARLDVLERTADHIAAAEHALHSLDIPHRSVDYADYLEHPARIAAELRELFELELTADDLNVRADLDHSAPRGWLPGQLRMLLRRLPRGPVRAIERMVPKRLVAWIFPERRYGDDARR